MNSLRKVNLLGIDITNASKNEVLEYIFEKSKIKNQKSKIYTPNPEMIVYADKHPEFKSILNSADIAIPDGIGLILAGKILGIQFKEKISGIDLMLDLCRRASVLPVSIGLLGAKDGVAERAAECLISMYPGLKIVYASSEWGEEGFKFPKKYQVSSIKYQFDNKVQNSEVKIQSSKFRVQSSIDILFVAFGAPKQEQWIAENIEKLPVRTAMGVGGAFDIISGDIKRASKFVQKLGLEWFYRLIREPWRWKRQLALFRFIEVVLKEKLKHKP